jgi:O-antigen ligase/polysaccharide polymerase Wzy-like membrane protein
MAARRLRLGSGELLAAGAATAATLLVLLLGSYKLGAAGLMLPLALVGAAILMRRPLAMLALVVALTALCEGPAFGLLSFSGHLYDSVYKGLTVLDVLLVLALVSVCADVLRRRRGLRMPRPLVLGTTMLLLAMVCGGVTGYAAGVSLRAVVFSESALAYLVAIPLAIVSLDIPEDVVKRLLGGLAAIAILKALLGLVEAFGHYGTEIEGNSGLSYYEAPANWLIAITLLCVFAAFVARLRPPLWLIAGSPLLVASLVLSYRRSFWIAIVLALLLVLLFGTTSAGRRVAILGGVVIAIAIWLLGSVGFQSQSPIVKRATSLSPTSLSANVEDRYRLDERANVWGAIEQHPITGLGMLVHWQATRQPLSVEHSEGRNYVHFAALWYWLKLGILGLVAYFSLLGGSALLAWRVWRDAREPLLRAFGLASLCGLAGLLVIETTASFTGVDLRFTVLLAAQIGLLASLATPAAERARSGP